MRIAESHVTALTIRHPRIVPETTEIAPATAGVVAPLALPPAHLTRYGTPDAGFVMQLIATAATGLTGDQAEKPTIHAASVGAISAYGFAQRTTQPASPGSLMVRSV